MRISAGRVGPFLEVVSLGFGGLLIGWMLPLVLELRVDPIRVEFRRVAQGNDVVTRCEDVRTTPPERTVHAMPGRLATPGVKCPLPAGGRLSARQRRGREGRRWWSYVGASLEGVMWR